MKRREFITFLGSTVIAWPLAALAQQGGAMRRIGVLMNAADDPESTTPTSASDEGSQQGRQRRGRLH